MPESTFANDTMKSQGRNADSSGVYFDENGNPLVKTSKERFSKPTVDQLGAIRVFTEAFLSVIPSAKYGNGLYTAPEYGFDYTQFESLTIIGKDFKGKEIPFTYKVYFSGREENGNRKTRGIIFKENVWFLEMTTLVNAIADASNKWLKEQEDLKNEAEKQAQKDVEAFVSQDKDRVKKVCELLGLSEADAIAYLAAGGSIEEAAKKVAEWNLASPSQRKALIASQNRKGFNASEYVDRINIPPIKYEGKSTEDLYDKIRYPYIERVATKAYISLVKESSSVKNGEPKGGFSALLTLKEFYMQSVSELDSEKYQIVETFNKPKIYFFDRRARIYQYSFIVENTGSDSSSGNTSKIHNGNPWRDLFKNTYDMYLRGTKCVENRVKAVIHYDEVTRIGYILSCAMNMDAQNENVASIQITMFVEDEHQRDVKPAVNLEYDKEKDIIKAASDLKKTVLVPYINNNEREFLGKLINLVNFYKDNSINRTDEPVKLTIKEVDILNSKNSSPYNGELTFIDVIIAGKSAKDSVGLIINPKEKDNKIGVGDTIYVEKDGLNVYPFVDSSSKFISSLLGEDKIIPYICIFKTKDDKKCELYGNIEIKQRNNIVNAVQKEGVINTIDNKVKCTKIEWSIFKEIETSSDGNYKIFKGEFEINYFDEVSVLQQDFPDEPIKPITLIINDIKKSINKSDASYLVNPQCSFSKVDDKTFKCEVTVNASINDETRNLQFTAESCILKGVQKIGTSDFDFRIKFIRGFDSKDWKLINFTSKPSLASNSIEKDKQFMLLSDVSFYFDKDPLLTGKEFVLGDKNTNALSIEGNTITKNNKTHELNNNIVKSAVSFNNSADIVNKIVFLEKTTMSPQEYQSLTNKVTQENVFIYRLRLSTYYPGTYLDLIKKIVNPSNVPMGIMVRIKEVKTNVNISISKYPDSQNTDISYVNENSDEFNVEVNGFSAIQSRSLTYNKEPVNPKNTYIQKSVVK